MRYFRSPCAAYPRISNGRIVFGKRNARSITRAITRHLGDREFLYNLREVNKVARARGKEKYLRCYDTYNDGLPGSVYTFISSLMFFERLAILHRVRRVRK